MRTVFNPSEITRLKDSANRFFMMARNFATPASEMMLIGHIQDVLNLRLKYTELPNNKLEHNKQVTVYYNSFTAMYSSDVNGNLELFRVIDTRVGMIYNYVNYQFSSVYHVQDGKVLEMITSLGSLGYHYSKPQTVYPSVLLSLSGSFKELN